MVQDGNVVLITGAGSGMGREVARKLAKRQWKIGALDQKADELESLRLELTGKKQVCDYREVDVTEAEAVCFQVAELENSLGPVNLLLACAGVAGETPAQTIKAQEVEHIVRVNLLGVSNVLAAVLPGMLARRRGHVVAISSLASLQGLPCQMAYCASKAGLNALMESLRLDVKDQGIHVTTICPGWTRTAQTAGQFDDADLMSVEVAANEILKAIDRRARFHAFPWWMVWQLKLMRWLPVRLQDRLLLRRIRQLKKGKECLQLSR